MTYCKWIYYKADHLIIEIKPLQRNLISAASTPTLNLLAFNYVYENARWLPIPCTNASCRLCTS